MDKFELYDKVIYQGKRVSITDIDPDNDRWRIAFNHGTHTTYKWVQGDDLSKPPTRTELMAQRDKDIERLKARDARFIQYCDSLSAMLLDLVEHHRANNTASVIVKIQEKHGVDLAPIFNPDIQWYRFTSQDQILEKWLNAYISEGLAAELLGVGRIEARMMMENKYGMDWRSTREILAEQRQEDENNQS